MVSGCKVRNFYSLGCLLGSFMGTKGDSIGVYDKYAEWYWRKMDQPGKVQKYFKDFHTKTYGPNFRYQDFAPMFKAELFDPAMWAELFRESGAKYVVLTSKHHE